MVNYGRRCVMDGSTAGMKSWKEGEHGGVM